MKPTGLSFLKMLVNQFLSQCFLNNFETFFTLQGRIEMQGNYNDILKSGIDIASMPNQNDENTGEDIVDIDETMEPKRNSSASSSLNNVKAFSGGIGENVRANEENQLLNELEVSPDRKVKESLLLSYLKSAKQPCMLVFLVITILLSQILVSLADIWISYW